MTQTAAANLAAELALPSAEEIRLARERISSLIWPTPVLHAERGLRILLKMECWQRTGSFKLRGALNKVLSLSEEEIRRGLVTASAGNHGLGLAEAARQVGSTCHVFMPQNASAAKREALERMGAAVHVAGVDYDEAEAVALEWAREEGLVYVHAFDDPLVIAGQGTVGLELLEQAPEFRTLYVPVGGGGLIAGVAAAVRALKPEVRIVGVQPEASPAMLRALQEGRVVETPLSPTLADGLAGRFVSERTLRACQLWVDEIALVSEEQIRRALRWFVDSTHTLAEPSAVVGIAAAFERRDPPPLATIVTGRNVDTGLLLQILNNGR